MPNATQMIRQDHRKVEDLFKKFEQTKGAQAKRRLAENAMAELEVHAALEEEIFYPAVREAINAAAVSNGDDVKLTTQARIMMQEQLNFIQ